MKNKSFIKNNKLVCGVGLFFALILFAAAIGVDTTHAAQILKSSITTGNGAGANPGEYFKSLYQMGVGLAGVLAVVMIVFGGIEYLTSAAFDTKTDAKNRIWAAIGGLLLALLSWLILYTIDPGLVNFSVDIPDGGSVRGSGALSPSPSTSKQNYGNTYKQGFLPNSTAPNTTTGGGLLGPSNAGEEGVSPVYDSQKQAPTNKDLLDSFKRGF